MIASHGMASHETPIQLKSLDYRRFNPMIENQQVNRLACGEASGMFGQVGQSMGRQGGRAWAGRGLNGTHARRATASPKRPSPPYTGGSTRMPLCRTS